jgi:hypothetical protein
MPGDRICDPKADKFAICSPAGTACGVGLGIKDSCQGDTLVYCLDGFKTKQDCTALGFVGCKDLVMSGAKLGAICY